MRKIIALIAIAFSLTASAQNKNQKSLSSQSNDYSLSQSTSSRVGILDGSPVYSEPDYRIVYPGGKVALRANLAMDTVEIDTSMVKYIKAAGKNIAVKDIFKKDTVAVPVYVINKTDTAKQASEMVVEFKKGRLYKTVGYYVFTQQMATTDGKQFQPISQPTIIGAVDQKKKPLKLFRQ